MKIKVWKIYVSNREPGRQGFTVVDKDGNLYSVSKADLYSSECNHLDLDRIVSLPKSILERIK